MRSDFEPAAERSSSAPILSASRGDVSVVVLADGKTLRAVSKSGRLWEVDIVRECRGYLEADSAENGPSVVRCLSIGRNAVHVSIGKFKYVTVDLATGRPSYERED